MIPSLAEFPNPGAKALLVEAHRAIPVRIMQNGKGRGRNREVLISLQDRDGASGNRRVKVGELIDASPLTEKETAELERLERELVGQAVSERSPKYKRYMALHQRALHAFELEQAERAAKRAAAFTGRGRA